MRSEFIWCLAFAALLGLALGVSAKHLKESAKEPQLYTVHFDGIDYQDLEQIRSTNYGSIYRTRAGKRIEFYGSFYEVEQ